MNFPNLKLHINQELFRVIMQVSSHLSNLQDLDFVLNLLILSRWSWQKRYHSKKVNRWNWFFDQRNLFVVPGLCDLISIESSRHNAELADPDLSDSI